MTVYLRVLWYTAEILLSQLDNECCDNVPEVLRVTAALTQRETYSDENADSYLCSALNKADSLWHYILQGYSKTVWMDGLVGEVQYRQSAVTLCDFW